MGKRFHDVFHFKGYGVESRRFLIRPRRLSGIDGERLTNPNKVSTGEFWRLMDMTMKG
jgi:hypothetical protein